MSQRGSRECPRCLSLGVLRGGAARCGLCRSTGQVPGIWFSALRSLTAPTPEELRWSPIMAGPVGQAIEWSIRCAWRLLWSWREWPWRRVWRLAGLVVAAEALLWGLMALLEPFAR